MYRAEGPIQLTFEKQYEILQMIERGYCQRFIAEKYGIPYFVMFAIKSRREKIIKFFEATSVTASSYAIILRMGYSDANLHKTLHEWYTQCIEKNINVTNAMLNDKALELNAQFLRNHNFKGSLRWVVRFKERLNFREEDISKDLRHQYEAEIFKAEIRELLQRGEYTLDNIYNADSTSLMWKAVPEKTLLFEKLQSSKGMGEEQVITLLCANATGCHKLPVLVISTIADFPYLNSFHLSDPSIMNETNIKPFMDSDILYEWFYKCFLKLVAEKQQKNGHREKTLLLLHNGGLDHRNSISIKDEFVKVMYYSYDAAPFIQPIDRRTIACFRRMYRNELLESLIPTFNNVSEEEFIHNYSQLNIEDCCPMIHNAWLKVKDSIFKNSWDKLLKNESEQSLEESEIIKKDINEALAKLNRLPGCGGCDSIAVMNWFETDTKHNIDTEDDIQDTLLDFINTAMDTGANEFTEENFEYILVDSSP